VAVLFVGLPLAAVFAKGNLVAGARSSVARDALLISLQTSLLSLAAMVLVGTPIAYLLATRTFPGRSIVITLFELPLVLPPAVAGLGLFFAFGRRGLLGSELSALGLEIPFTKLAVVLAMTFVAAPLYLRQAQSAFAAVEPDLLSAARTLGAGPARVFLRVAVPVAGEGLGVGAALGWARALGEFGATIIFAGSLQGVTQTAPVAIYLGFEGGRSDAAFALGAVMIAVSAAVLLAVKLLGGRSSRFAPV
jgi:molybdate transport system permease protein